MITMTGDERLLLAALRRWLRENKAYPTCWGTGYRLADGRQIEWETTGARRWPHFAEVGVHPDSHRPLTWHEVQSVTQAVDVLVALGYLPVWFSSAYRAGWDSAIECRTLGMDAAAHPAVSPTW